MQILPPRTGPVEFKCMHHKFTGPVRFRYCNQPVNSPVRPNTTTVWDFCQFWLCQFPYLSVRVPYDTLAGPVRARTDLKNIGDFRWNPWSPANHSTKPKGYSRVKPYLLQTIFIWSWLAWHTTHHAGTVRYLCGILEGCTDSSLGNTFRSRDILQEPGWQRANIVLYEHLRGT